MYVCSNGVSMAFMGAPVLGALISNNFPVASQGTEFAMSRFNNRFAVSVGGVVIYFCENNNNCPSEWLGWWRRAGRCRGNCN
jgi:hypothetical protein